MTTRELHFRIQERLENLASTASQMSGEHPSQIEIDLLLTKLRETYDEVLYMKRIALQSFVKQAPKASAASEKTEKTSPKATTKEETESDDIFQIMDTAVHANDSTTINSKISKETEESAFDSFAAALETIKEPTEPKPAEKTTTIVEEKHAVEESILPVTSKPAVVEAPKEKPQEEQAIFIEKSIEPEPIKPIIASQPKAVSEPKQTPAAAPKETASTKSVHDLLNNYQGAKIQPAAVKNLGAAIGLNDKFQFIRELFNSSSDEFNKTINELNGMKTFEDAHQFLNKHYGWDDTDPVVVKFLEIINRRYL